MKFKEKKYIYLSNGDLIKRGDEFQYGSEWFKRKSEVGNKMQTGFAKTRRLVSN
jgi:hypothetical protein